MFAHFPKAYALRWAVSFAKVCVGLVLGAALTFVALHVVHKDFSPWVFVGYAVGTLAIALVCIALRWRDDAREAR